MAIARDFLLLMAQAGFTTKQLADYCGVSIRTVHRWKQRNLAPPLVVKHLKILAKGFLPDSRDWAGFYIDRDGFLVTETGVRLSTGELNALFYTFRQLRNLETENRELKERLATIQGVIDSGGAQVVSFERVKTEKELKELQKAQAKTD